MLSLCRAVCSLSLFDSLSHLSLSLISHTCQHVRLHQAQITWYYSCLFFTNTSLWELADKNSAHILLIPVYGRASTNTLELRPAVELAATVLKFLSTNLCWHSECLPPCHLAQTGNRLVWTATVWEISMSLHKTHGARRWNIWISCVGLLYMSVIMKNTEFLLTY